MQITIHRGTHRIGGCVTEIKSPAARIIIDMGASLSPEQAESDASLRIDGVTCGEPDCDGVLITHCHGDHVGLFESVLLQIPIYTGSVAKRIYKLVQQTVKDKLGKGSPERVETFKEYAAGQPLYFKDIKVTPYCIDHSAFDAYMFLIECGGKRILHTGDIRMHGARGRKMPYVFQKYARNIDALIIEGTMLSRQGEKVKTMHELGRDAEKLLKDSKNVFVLCSSTDIDAIAEFYAAAEKVRKPFVVCERDYQAEILRIATSTATSSFDDFERRKVYVYGNNLHPFMNERGFCFLGRFNAVTQRVMQSFPDNLLIYSMWRGYLDKTHAAYDEYKSAFIEKAVSLGSKFEYLHTSGHASIEDIEKICRITQARVVIPIHCEVPESFGKLDIDGEIRVLSDGESLDIG